MEVSNRALERRIADLVDRDWNGYFVRVRADNGHVTPGTITARFKRFTDRANVVVRGDTPISQCGRRVWYRTSGAPETTLESN